MSGDDESYTVASWLIDGLNINNHCITGTSLARIPEAEGSGYRACIELGEHGLVIEGMSRLGWLEAAEGAARQVYWFLSRREQPGQLDG